MSNCTVLIVDDDPDDVEILKEAFKTTGVEAVHNVPSATQAFKFLEVLETKNALPQLIVTDMYLTGGVNGVDFVEDLKNMEPYKHIEVLILSTTKNEGEMEKYRQIGVTDYLVKPSSYEEYKQMAEYIKSKLEL